MNKLQKITILFSFFAVLFAANISYAQIAFEPMAAALPAAANDKEVDLSVLSIDLLSNAIAEKLASTTLNVKLVYGSTSATSTSAATDGENTISILLYILILLTIFSGVHNAFIGVKIKKQLYD